MASTIPSTRLGEGVANLRPVSPCLCPGSDVTSCISLLPGRALRGLRIRLSANTFSARRRLGLPRIILG